MQLQLLRPFVGEHYPLYVLNFLTENRLEICATDGCILIGNVIPCFHTLSGRFFGIPENNLGKILMCQGDDLTIEGHGEIFTVGAGSIKIPLDICEQDKVPDIRKVDAIPDNNAPQINEYKTKYWKMVVEYLEQLGETEFYQRTTGPQRPLTITGSNKTMHWRIVVMPLEL